MTRAHFRLIGYALAALALLFVVASVGRSLGFRWDPFNLQGRKLERETVRADTAESDASARGLEAEGERDQAQRIEHYYRQEVILTDHLSRAETLARSAPDANEPLPPERAERLLASDRELCRVVPAACRRPAAAPVDSDGGDDALPASDAP